MKINHSYNYVNSVAHSKKTSRDSTKFDSLFSIHNAQDTFEYISSEAEIYNTYSQSADYTSNISALTEIKTQNYLITPNSNADYIDIFDNDGHRLGVFYKGDIEIKVESSTGKELLLSEHGSMSYDVISMTDELKSALCQVLQTNELRKTALDGFSIQIHEKTGIKYIQKDDEIGKGGKILIENSSDLEKFNYLVKEYFQKYPNIVNNLDGAAIYAELEITGIVRGLPNGILHIGYDGLSYTDNSDSTRNWAIKFSTSVLKKVSDWLKSNSNYVGLEQIKTWLKVIGKDDYERIWSDEEIRRGYLFQ